MSDITLGIIGGGQLGSMLAIAAKKLNIKTGMYSPLVFGTNTLGIASIDSTSLRAEFTQKDLDLFVNITQVLSALIAAKKKEGAQPPGQAP